MAEHGGRCIKIRPLSRDIPVLLRDVSGVRTATTAVCSNVRVNDFRTTLLPVLSVVPYSEVSNRAQFVPRFYPSHVRITVVNSRSRGRRTTRY